MQGLALNTVKEQKGAFPARNFFNHEIINAATLVQNYYIKKNEDPNFQGFFEETFCKEFSEFMGGGYCDAVCSGTVAVYLSISALCLPKGSYVLISPITDPGTVNAILFNGLIPYPIDSTQFSFNISSKSVGELFSSSKLNISAVLVVHVAGEVAEIEEIANLCKSKDVKVIEDCSQAHGASVGTKKVGTFGDTSSFSLMSRKTIAVNGSAGMVYSKSKKFYRTALAMADRGKPTWKKNYDPRDPGLNLFPSLNFNLDEISSALGSIALAKIDNVIKNRRHIVTQIKKKINCHSKYFFVPYKVEGSSPFVVPVFKRDLSCNLLRAEKFGSKLKEAGVPLNENYKFLTSSWKYLKKYVPENLNVKNAENAINNSFVLYLNENYRDSHIEIIVEKLLALEKEFDKFSYLAAGNLGKNSTLNSS